MAGVLLVLNAGSSSLKFQVFDQAGRDRLTVRVRGQFDGLGGQAAFRAENEAGIAMGEAAWDKTARFGHEEALIHLVNWLREHQGGDDLRAIGHRVVHGGELYARPTLVDDIVLSALERFIPLAPLHQPHNLEPIRIVRRRMPGLAQVACFDTAFHRTQPEIAQMFALPREIRERGVRRYGFHGLSYEYIASVLPRFDDKLAAGRTVVAHLGNGASLCALKGGVSVATTMGFSALEGLPMGTRSGAIDPGVVFYMLRDMGMSIADAEAALYKKSGLLGVSGLSNDMRVLRQAAATNAAARQAIDLFVYRIQREIGSMAAALGGVDGLVFTAGIGQHDRATRQEVLAGLAWLGFRIDEAANDATGPRCISTGEGPRAWVMPTDEEGVIARHTRQVIEAGPARLAS